MALFPLRLMPQKRLLQLPLQQRLRLQRQRTAPQLPGLPEPLGQQELPAQQKLPELPAQVAQLERQAVRKPPEQRVLQAQ